MSVKIEIEEVLKSFQPISLKEMDTVELMNRTDTKFIFNSRNLPELLASSSAHFKILEIKNERLFSYKTTYYDTPEYLLFNNHMQGKLNRHKIRHRTYESTGVSYLEIKFKSNKNRTIKWRIKNQVNGHFDNHAVEFLHDYTALDIHKLNPVVTNMFSRITLVSIEDKTRVTLDFNISFQRDHHFIKELPFLAIAEVKQEGANNNCFFIQLLRKKGIRQAGFSKYCIGSALLYDIPRANSLKPKFLHLNRIKNEYDAYNIS